MELRQQIEALIIKGKTDRALNLLKNQEGLPKSFHDEITLLQSIFEKNEKERGTLVSYDDADIQRNRINLKTLNLTSDIAKYQNAPKRSPKNLFRKPALRTPETNDLAGEVDNIRQKLLERYEHRLAQKTDNRLHGKPTTNIYTIGCKRLWSPVMVFRPRLPKKRWTSNRLSPYSTAWMRSAKTKPTTRNKPIYATNVWMPLANI